MPKIFMLSIRAQHSAFTTVPANALLCCKFHPHAFRSSCMACMDKALAETPVFRFEHLDQPRLALRSSEFGQVGTAFVEVVDFIPLQIPEFGVHRGGAERAVTEVFQLTDSCVARMMTQTMLDGTTVADRVQEAVQKLARHNIRVANLQDDGTCLPSSALQLPVGLCFLIRNALWQSLVLVPNSKWDLDCDVLGLLQEVKLAAAQCDMKGQSLKTFVPPEDLQPVHHFFSTLADDLCEWSRAIISSSSDEDCTASDLEQYVIWLNSMREATSQHRAMAHVWEAVTANGKRLLGGDFNKLTGAHGRYRALFLIQCVLLAFELKSSSSLAVGLQRAFAVLPDIWSKTLQQCFSVQCTPSGATISRSRLYLDAAFMLHMRERHEHLTQKSSVFFVLMDSSPQGFQNWMMSEASS